MALTVILGDRDVTDQAGSLSYSNVDPGGHEACSFTLPNDAPWPLPGTPVTIWEGMTRAWLGRVEEPGDDLDARAAPSQVTAVGPGAALKDQTMSMVYIDRALGRWQGPSRARQIALLGVNFAAPNAGAATPDTTTGLPALDTGFDEGGGWGATSKPIAEAWYDAGDGNLLGRIRADWAKTATVSSGADGNWVWEGALETDDLDSSSDSTGDLQAAGPGSADRAATTSRRFAMLRLYYNAAGGTAGSNLRYSIYWTNLRVFGDHGLTIRGASAALEGFYPSDIADHARGLAGGIAAGIITPSTSYIVPHVAYYTRVAHEQIIDDMAKLLGWHWGVWEPLNPFDTTPRLDFRAPPTDATASVMREDCQQLKLTQRLSDFHNRAEIRWTDPAGTSGTAVVTLANPNMPTGLTRTLQLDAGTSTALVAAQIGTDALALEQQQARAAGSVILPAMVMTPGGMLPSHLLRAGLDRLKIIGLPSAGAWTDADTRRYDVFRVRRVTVARDQNGAPRTTAELDSGANLLEVLNARLAIDAALAA
jgi:hypothetical protein